MTRHFIIKNYSISLIYKLLIYLTTKLSTIFLDFELIEMIFVVLCLYNLSKSYPNF